MFCTISSISSNVNLSMTYGIVQVETGCHNIFGVQYYYTFRWIMLKAYIYSPTSSAIRRKSDSLLTCSVLFCLGLTTMLVRLDRFQLGIYRFYLVIQNFIYAEAKNLHSRWWVWRSLYSAEVRITCLAWWQETTGKFWLCLQSC